jgi:hypothetical protein
LSPHESPDIRGLERAKAFFAQNQGFQSAARVRIQVQRRSMAEAKELQTAIDPKLGDAVVHYQTQHRTVSQPIQNEKNTLKRDCDQDTAATISPHLRP